MKIDSLSSKQKDRLTSIAARTNSVVHSGET